MLVLTATALLVFALSTKTPPLLDGRCDDAEWASASKRELGQGLQLQTLQDKRSVYLCITNPAQGQTTFDLYLETKDGRINLHSSAQVGERVWNGRDWGRWTWRNHVDWFSPAVPIDRLVGSELFFAPAPYRELQLQKSRFGDGPWRFMLEIRQIRTGERSVVTFPTDADPSKPETWAALGSKAAKPRP